MNNTYDFVITVRQLLRFMLKYKVYDSFFDNINLDKKLYVNENQLIICLEKQLGLKGIKSNSIYSQLKMNFIQSSTISNTSPFTKKFWEELRSYSKHHIIYPDE